MPQTILSTKLFIPPIKPGLVSRPRLLDKLNLGLGRGGRLTLVSAPAGYGKSTLIREWLASLGLAEPDALPEGPLLRKFAWLYLDEGDNDLVRFLHYWIAALQRCDERIGRSVLALLDLPGQLPAEATLAPLINDLAGLPEQVVFVLDDYHAIHSMDVHQWLDAFLENQPPNLHLVLATRTDPLLRLSRLRARGYLTELRSEDLRFTQAEAAAFLSGTMGLGLPQEDMDTLGTQTEGWVAGLQLAALSLGGEGSPVNRLRAFSGEDRFVMDYLVEEVLQHQPESVQSFLLKTAVLDRMCAAECDALLQESPVTGASSQEMLEYLERANLFVIPLDNQRAWYRYHHLFADLLRLRAARQMGKAGVARLQVLASRWCEQNDHITEAVQYTLAAGDSDRLADLLELYGIQLIQRATGPLPASWVDGLCSGACMNRPMLCAVLAFSELFAHPDPPGVVEEKIDTIELALEKVPDPRNGQGQPIRDTVLGYADALRAAVGRIHNLPSDQVITYAAEAMRLLPADAGLARFNACRALYSGLLIQGNAQAAGPYIAEAIRIARDSQDEYHLLSSIFSQAHVAAHQGRLKEAARICQAAQEEIAGPTGQQGYPLAGSGSLDLWMGRIALEWNDSDRAETLLQSGLEKLRYFYEIFMKMRAWGWLARIAALRQDDAAVENTLAECRKTWSGASRYADCIQVRLWLQRGAPADFKQAARWAETIPLDRENIPLMRSMLLDGEWHNVEQMTLARVLIAQRRSGDAVDLQPLQQALDVQQAVAAECGWGERELEVWMLKSLACLASGEAGAAIEAARNALALAEPGGYLRTFLDEGELMRQLIEYCRRSPQKDPRQASTDYLDRLLAAFPHVAPTEKPGQPAAKTQLGLVEPLTDRELEVLHLVADGLSNGEISQKLYLSPNTLKAHTQNIYSKLDVHSRMQAVVRARELGII